MLPDTFPLEVYDLSEFMDRHPGGPTTIVAWAGKDASKFFNEIHKGVKTLGAEAVYCMHSELQIFPCRNLDPQLKIKLQRLETQKRAALDSEAGKIFELKLFPASRPLRNT
ncbi:unnamed protein product [Durusdinium trenchii]|uniref:Cytochrome b5 heme-binding domain-containing protein n=1 Tax=Durusdinium trenchii TaxID=1381693 RepID=A0ABP0IB44_9DINO